jgi:hypothetical protein
VSNINRISKTIKNVNISIDISVKIHYNLIMKIKSKFKIGDIVEATRSGSLATILDVGHFTYKVKYSEQSYGVIEYLIAEFDNYWDLKLSGQDVQQNQQCTCGIWKTYGKNNSKGFHSSYCDLIKIT